MSMAVRPLVTTNSAPAAQPAQPPGAQVIHAKGEDFFVDPRELLIWPFLFLCTRTQEAGEVGWGRGASE